MHAEYKVFLYINLRRIENSTQKRRDFANNIHLYNIEWLLFHLSDNAIVNCYTTVRGSAT